MGAADIIELLKWGVAVGGGGAFAFLWREITSNKNANSVSIARIWAEIDKMKTETAEHRVLVAQQYVTRTDFAELRNEMREGFRELAKLIRRDKGSE